MEDYHFNSIRKEDEEDWRRNRSFLLSLSDSIRDLEDPDKIKFVACKMLGEQLNADRTYYGDFDFEHGLIIIAADHIRKDSASLSGTYPIRTFDWVVAVLNEGKILVINDALNSSYIPSRQVDTIMKLGIGSFISVPLIKHNKLEAALTVIHKGKRNWTISETELVFETAERTWETISRVKAEAFLRESEAFAKKTLSAIMGVIPDMISLQEYPSLKLTFSNKDSFEAVGFNIDELLSLTWAERSKMIHPDDLPDVVNYYNLFETLRDDETLTVKYRVRSSTKRIIWLLARGRIFKRDHQGKVISILHIVQDITSQKLVENKFREESHFISQIMEATPDIIYILDLNTYQTIYSNRQVAKDLGYKKEDIGQLKNAVIDLIHPDDYRPMIQHLEKIKTFKSDSKVVEIEYRLKSARGGYHWFKDRNMVFKRNKSGAPVEKIGICQDINTNKENEARRRTDRGIIRQSEQLAEMGSWDYEIDTGEFNWSDGMFRLFNLDAEEKPDPSIYLDYCIDDDREKAKEIVNAIKKNFLPFEETLTIAPVGNDYRILKIRAEVQYDQKNKPIRVVGVDLDITKPVRTHQDISNLNNELIRNSQRLELMNEEIKTFNKIAALDYKETLKQLYTNLEYIISKDARNLSESGRTNIRRAQSAIQRMNLLTDDINHYFSLSEVDYELRLINPNPVLKEVLGRYAARFEQLEVSVQYKELPDIYSHPELLYKLFSSLIDHSLKTRNISVPLVIHIQYSSANEVKNTKGKVVETGAFDIISFRDNGPGITQEEAESIFDLFYRVSGKSDHKTGGIGLSVCKKIMEIHDGFIVAEGIPTKGAIFSCYFPGGT
jgi:PAS domain S-box-containing protein